MPPAHKLYIAIRSYRGIFMVTIDLYAHATVLQSCADRSVDVEPNHPILKRCWIISAIGTYTSAISLIHINTGQTEQRRLDYNG